MPKRKDISSILIIGAGPPELADATYIEPIKWKSLKK